MPSGADGFYYFSAYLRGDDAELGYFDIEINGDLQCTVYVDTQETIGDFAQSACSTVTYAAQGNQAFHQILVFQDFFCSSYHCSFLGR